MGGGRSGVATSVRAFDTPGSVPLGSQLPSEGGHFSHDSQGGSRVYGEGGSNMFIRTTYPRTPRCDGNVDGDGNVDIVEFADTWSG